MTTNEELFNLVNTVVLHVIQKNFLNDFVFY